MSAKAHARFEELLAHAMRADDPVAALEAAVADPELDRETRDALGQIDHDGVRIQALLVARMRFERLLQGSTEAEAIFESDPSAFSALFRAYHRDVAMTAFFPAAEAALFGEWQRRA